LDLDSDNDGIPDAVEAQPTEGYEGNDGDVSDDVDENGVPPYGLVDPLDSDGDGIPDYLDVDSDNDGIFDMVESGLPTSELLDADNNGMIDTILDLNGDGVDDSINTSYSDPDGDIDNPSEDLTNQINDTTEVGYRELYADLVLLKEGHFNDENGNGLADIGETISYSFTITNIGDVVLTDVYIEDLLPGIELEGEPITLLPGETDSSTFTAVYEITSSDIDRGYVERYSLRYYGRRSGCK